MQTRPPTKIKVEYRPKETTELKNEGKNKRHEAPKHKGRWVRRERAHFSTYIP